jgi:hypothetical protein
MDKPFYDINKRTELTGKTVGDLIKVLSGMHPNASIYLFGDDTVWAHVATNGMSIMLNDTPSDDLYKTESMEYYILCDNRYPLSYDGKAIKFKTAESAQAFYETAKRLVPEPVPDHFSCGVVTAAILFDDGGYMRDGGSVELRDLTKEQLDSMAEGFYDEYMKILRSLSHE